MMSFARSEIELCRKLENAGVTGGVVLAKERAERSAAGTTNAVGNGQSGIVIKDGTAGLARAVGDVYCPVYAGELSMIEDVEGLDTQLQIMPALLANGDILRQRQVLIVDSRIAEIH